MLKNVGNLCTGCGACSNICPKSAISMDARPLDGFLYPKVNQDRCIQCGLCEKTCPILNKPSASFNETVAYAIQNQNDLIRSDSTSGGAFSAIATYVLNLGGVVFGAMYDENLDVVHGYVNNTDDLKKLRRSKYVQSRLGNTFKEVKNFLKEGRWVCFSGTPCQIAGLHNYLRSEHEKLILVDIVCHGTPSPKVWSLYREMQEKRYSSKILSADFRYKKFGYSSSVMALKFENGKTYFKGHESDLMLKAFFSEIVSRKSCFQCHFKGIKRISDFTMYDCWSIGTIDKKMDDNKGTTVLLLQSDKSRSIWRSIQKDLNYREISLENSIKHDGMMLVSCAKENPNRDAFYEELNKFSFEDVCQKFIPITLKDSLKGLFKPILYKIGFLKIINNYRTRA